MYRLELRYGKNATVALYTVRHRAIIFLFNYRFIRHKYDNTCAQDYMACVGHDVTTLTVGLATRTVRASLVARATLAAASVCPNVRRH